mmetsp:Transcript_10365/g.26070  ORF Transcript_10365/g.26070 Transcript_10365/m.26070 type:complete len:212 (+) Transcript_10365:48-683(+)
MSSRLSQRAKKQEKYRRHVASLTSNANKEDGAEEPYNPIKPKIRYVAESSDDLDSKREVSKDYKNRYRNPYQRTGRSLTRTSEPISRSSSASSNGSKEPGQIVSRPRPGRSLTRSPSVDGKSRDFPRGVPCLPRRAIATILPRENLLSRVWRQRRFGLDQDLVHEVCRKIRRHCPKVPARIAQTLLAPAFGHCRTEARLPNSWPRRNQTQV